MVFQGIAVFLAWMPVPNPPAPVVRFSLPSDVPAVMTSSDRSGVRPSTGGLIAVPATVPLRSADQPAVSSIPPYELAGPRRDEPLAPGVIAYSEGVIRAADRRYSFTFLHGPNWRPWHNPAQLYLPGTAPAAPGRAPSAPAK